jgi:hypothetical protein
MSLKKKALLALAKHAAPAVIDAVRRGPARDLWAEERQALREEGARLSREDAHSENNSRRRRRRRKNRR